MKKLFAFLSLVFRLVAPVILLQTLYFKFGMHPDSVYIFMTLGVEPWGRIGSGIMELIAAVLILVPRTAWIGAFVAIGTMMGAIMAHLIILGISVNNDGGSLFFLAVLVLVSSLFNLYLARSIFFADLAWIGLYRKKALE